METFYCIKNEEKYWKNNSKYEEGLNNIQKYQNISSAKEVVKIRKGEVVKISIFETELKDCDTCILNTKDECPLLVCCYTKR